MSSSSDQQQQQQQQQQLILNCNVDMIHDNYFFKCMWSGWTISKAYGIPSLSLKDGKFAKRREGCFVNPACAVAYVIEKRDQAMAREAARVEADGGAVAAVKGRKSAAARYEELNRKFETKLGCIAIDLGLARLVETVISSSSPAVNATNTTTANSNVLKAYSIEHIANTPSLKAAPKYGPHDNAPVIDDYMLGRVELYADARYNYQNKNRNNNAVATATTTVPITAVTTSVARKPAFHIYTCEVESPYAYHDVVVKELNATASSSTNHPVISSSSTIILTSTIGPHLVVKDFNIGNRKALLIHGVAAVNKDEQQQVVLAAATALPPSDPPQINLYAKRLTGHEITTNCVIIATEEIKEICTKEDWDKEIEKHRKQQQDRLQKRRLMLEKQVNSSSASMTNNYSSGTKQNNNNNNSTTSADVFVDSQTLDRIAKKSKFIF